MVKVTVYCLSEMVQEELKSLFDKLFNVLKQHVIITWVIEEKDELILFPLDKWQYGLGQEILVEVEGLKAGLMMELGKKEIGAEMRSLGKDLRAAMKRIFPSANVVCHVYPPNPGVIICDSD